MANPAAQEPPVALTRERYAEVVGNLLAVRRLATEMTELFAATGRGGKEDKAARGARAMVDSIDLVLDALGYAGDR